MSHIMCHVSHVTCHLSHVTLFYSSFLFRTKWWSLLVEGLLSTGPTPSSLKSFQLSGQKNHATSWDKKNHATSWDKKNHATSCDKKNHATSLDKKITQPFATKKNHATSWHKTNHATSLDKKITLSIGPIAFKLVHKAPNCSKWHQIGRSLTKWVQVV